MTKVFKLKESGIEWVESGDSTVILDGVGEQYFAANPAGSMLWKLLKEGTTRETMAATLVEAYGIDTSLAERDVDTYIAQLDEFDLLEPTPG